MKIQVQPGTLSGTIQVPPSKSMAHRLLICAALCQGTSKVNNIDYSVDISTTISALQTLGVAFAQEDTAQQVTGNGRGFSVPQGAIHFAESGSTLRFLIPLFGLVNQAVVLTGAPRLLERPMQVYQTIFEQQGLLFLQEKDKITVKGPLHSGSFTLRGDVSSQFISGLLLALPLLQGDSTLSIIPPFESRSYVELTRKAQALFGIKSWWKDEFTLHIPGGQHYTPTHCTVEGDWSQAAVPAVVAAVTGGIDIDGLSHKSAQGDTVVLDILQRCGASVQWEQDILQVRPGKNPLCSPGVIDLADCPDLGPILCTLALFCTGETRFVNAGRLRIKESDRIASVQQEFAELGAAVEAGPETIVVQGVTKLRSDVCISSHNDHRIVMAGVAAALCGNVSISIEGAQAITKSWPSFFEDFSKLGACFLKSE